MSNFNLGKMVFFGPMAGGKTYSGHNLDEAKSAVQKYIRRGETIKAIQAGIELYRIVEVDPKAVGVQTNMYNRIAVSAAEDIGIGNFSLVLATINWVLNLKNRDPHELAAVIHTLTLTGKTRIQSHIWVAWGTEKGRKIGKDNFNFIGDEEDPEIKIIDPKYWSGEPESVIKIANNFIGRLIQKDLKAVYWLSLFRKETENLKINRRRRRTDPMIIIWDLIRATQFYPTEVFDIMEKAYFHFSEKKPFLMLMITALILSPVYEPFSFNENFEKWKNSEQINWFLNPGPDYSFILDPYVIDVHTRAGRSRGCTKRNFVLEGAVVYPEININVNDCLAEIYRLHYW